MTRRFQYYMITDPSGSRQPLPDMAIEAERAGVNYFQLRAKHMSRRELLVVAKEIRKHLRETKFVVNGALDVALAVMADGLHLQKNNLPVESIRSRYPHLLIGYSAHSFEEMKEVETKGADYVWISPIFSPISKGFAGNPHGVSNLIRWTKRMKIDVFALGGISPQNLPDVKRSGCAGAAGISLFLKDGHFSSSGMVV